MSLRTEIPPYIDGNGLVAPYLVQPGTMRASDNGIMFTSEYYIMLNRNHECSPTDVLIYYNLIGKEVGSDKDLHRAPGDTTQDAPDDYHGVIAGYAEFGLKPDFEIPILDCLPQLVFAYLLGKGVPSFVLFPFNVYTAVVLAISCINTPVGNTDARRLNWLLWQATKRKSILCNLAGKFWHWRQTKVYNTQNVMQAVAKIYYQDNHPFQRYWVD